MSSDFDKGGMNSMSELTLQEIISILRVNGMHQATCSYLQSVQRQRGTDMYIPTHACDCWLSAPPTTAIGKGE